MNKLAPIVIFVFARPAHTKRTLDALADNFLANQSDLIIFSDAARLPCQTKDVQDVRTLIRSTTGFRSITIIERDENYGLARSIIEGVTEVCNHHGRVIVLEDDILTSKYFLTFMNDGLDTYSEVGNVYAISGCTYPIDLQASAEDTFFLRLPLCWGWATWKEKWCHFKKCPASIPNTAIDIISYINFDGCHNFFAQAKDNFNKITDTWFIFWYMTLAHRKALALFPRESLVENIGHDGSGENCTKSFLFNKPADQRPINVKLLAATEGEYELGQHKKFFQSTKKSLLSRIIGKINREIRRIK
ncbi:hypothetical protein [Methylibium sp.]|uniref:hypothetical protein n=1 Tax=Methylibium sp. TaxID=2067992 RepID=UPI003D118961